jgi:hypothetical protein
LTESHRFDSITALVAGGKKFMFSSTHTRVILPVSHLRISSSPPDQTGEQAPPRGRRPHISWELYHWTLHPSEAAAFNLSKTCKPQSTMECYTVLQRGRLLENRRDRGLADADV